MNVKINVNTKCRVTLSPYGAELLEGEIEQRPLHLRPDRRYRAGDVYECEVWVMMQTFGPVMCNGLSPFDGSMMEIDDAEPTGSPSPCRVPT